MELRERREYPRAPIEITAEAIVRDQIYVGLSRNISGGGMFLRLPEAPPLRAVLELRFLLPGDSTPIAVDAEVVWTIAAPAPQSASRKLPAAVGIRFLHLDGRDRERILAYVRSLDE